MDQGFNYTVLTIGVIAIIIGRAIMKKSGTEAALNAARSFIPTEEGFRSTPYWDVKRWSWGYGTQAPGPTGTIDRDTATLEMMKHVTRDFERLQRQITNPLGNNQWAALLSFSYNLGVGNAEKLVPYINYGDYTGLGKQWQRYVYSDGVVNQDLVDRRRREWELFVS